MSGIPECPKCKSIYVYQDVEHYVCPECGYDWPLQDNAIGKADLKAVDANGNFLQNGDTVSVIKDLKVKGSSGIVKVGTKIKKIRIIDGDHNIDCRIEGVGAMQLKSEFVRKC